MENQITEERKTEIDRMLRLMTENPSEFFKCKLLPVRRSEMDYAVNRFQKMHEFHGIRIVDFL